MKRNRVLLALAALAISSLSACGGGSGSHPTPVPTPQSTPQTTLETFADADGSIETLSQELIRRPRSVEAWTSNQMSGDTTGGKNQARFFRRCRN